ncbi:MAG: hypothetical protein JST22_18670 [Bacteroidetes bacterium]|nr:hypothetical protein [Bacteroidota bacterium]
MWLFTVILATFALAAPNNAAAQGTGSCADSCCLTDALSLNTGYDHANGTTYAIGSSDGYWTIVSDPAVGPVPRPATVVAPAAGWGPAQPGTRWIAALPTAADSIRRTVVYQKCFCVCDTTTITIDLNVMADDTARISVDGVVIGTTTGIASGTPQRIVATMLLVPGRHCVRVAVINSSLPSSGFDIRGTIQGPHLRKYGCCPDLTPCQTDSLTLGTDDSWSIIADPNGGVPRCAQMIAKHKFWGQQNGASWIGPNATGFVATAAGYTYQKCFCVIEPTTVNIIMNVMGAHAVDVLMDGVFWQHLNSNAATTPANMWRSVSLMPGCHCFQFVVYDSAAVENGLNALITISSTTGPALMKDSCCTCAHCDTNPCATGHLHLGSNHYWSITAAPDSLVPRCASVVTNLGSHPFWGSQPGGEWIGPSATAMTSGGDYTYRKCFCVREHATIISTLSVMGDDAVDVKLDGVPVFTVPNYGASSPHLHTDTIQVDSGCHCFEFVVHDLNAVESGLNAVIDLQALMGSPLLQDSCCPCARCYDPCRTDSLNIVTDSNWTLTAAPDSIVPRCVDVIPRHAVWGQIPGAQWIAPNPTGNTGSPGDYTYRKCFCVEDSTTITYTVRVLADDAVDVKLDGVAILSVPNYAGQVVHSVTHTVAVGPGCHCFEFIVHDVGAVETGLNAWLTIASSVPGALLQDSCCECGSCHQQQQMMQFHGDRPDLSHAVIKPKVCIPCSQAAGHAVLLNVEPPVTSGSSGTSSTGAMNAFPRAVETHGGGSGNGGTSDEPRR